MPTTQLALHEHTVGNPGVGNGLPQGLDAVWPGSLENDSNNSDSWLYIVTCHKTFLQEYYLIDRIARTFCFTNYGHGMYLCSPTEIQKFTLAADFCKDLQDMLGELFQPCDNPEPPKQSFFKGLFGGGVSQLDREELCKVLSFWLQQYRSSGEGGMGSAAKQHLSWDDISNYGSISVI
ncbi:Syntaxin-binding protein 5 [Halocaridina rubra]|uniref:Syntaxin-binding protein 5 n=1 Tax=Halocaridina rubra TaxID=373956 RepID=A0AAN8XID9_HALRR